MGKLIPFHWGLLGHPKRAEPYARAEHMRMALEDFATTRRAGRNAEAGSSVYCLFWSASSVRGSCGGSGGLEEKNE